MSALALIGHLSHKLGGSRRTTLAAGLGALVFAGMALVAVRLPSAPPRLTVRDNVPAIFEGCVVDPALIAGDRERFTVELAPGARAQVSLFTRTGVYPDLPYGTRLEFQGKVRQTHNYNDPGTFDSVRYLASQHIYWTAAADAGKLARSGGTVRKPR